jgi:hypothetical protein
MFLNCEVLMKIWEIGQWDNWDLVDLKIGGG